jgi:hypothetical protein
MMKKLLLVTIIAIVFISGTIVGAIPFATAVGSGVTPDRPIIQQLNAISKVLTKIDQRLERVLGHIGPPQQPATDPDIIQRLQDIKNTAETIITRVDQKLPTPVPTPPPDIG